MSQLVKKVAVAFVVAVLAVPLTAAVATADNGGSMTSGPKCCP